jgi:hypothetical protein
MSVDNETRKAFDLRPGEMEKVREIIGAVCREGKKPHERINGLKACMGQMCTEEMILYAGYLLGTIEMILTMEQEPEVSAVLILVPGRTG